MNRRKYHQTTRFVGLAAALLLVATASLAHAQNYPSLYWNQTGPANWSVGSYWTSANDANYYNGGSIITNGGTVNITSSVTDNSGGGFVIVGGTDPNGSGNGYVNMTAGALGGLLNPLQEVFGVGSGSGVFTQSGGTNSNFVGEGGTTADNYANNYTSVQVGAGPGGYGEYDLKGNGQLNTCALFVGGNNGQKAWNNQGVSDAGTGVFNQTTGSVGSFGSNLYTNNAVGLAVGGEFTPGTVKSSTATPYVASASGTYTLGNADGTGSPLLVGGVEGIGVNGTGTFTQNSGTNAIYGGGNATGILGGNASYNTGVGALLLGVYSGSQAPRPYDRHKQRQGELLRLWCGNVQPHGRALDRRPWWLEWPLKCYVRL